LDALEGREERAAFSSCLQALLRNDLEPAAQRLCPPVGRIKRRMEASGALAAGMSGSGATVFGVFSSTTEARKGQQQLDAGNAAWSRLGSTHPSPGNGK
jgi:4-diphosphocytidyl-2C-methyl-D-erythritol kinase